MANTKMKKVVAILAVLAMVATVIPAAVFAANTVEIAADYEKTADQINVTATGTLSGAGDVTVLAVRTTETLNGVIPDELDEDSIMYVDQKTVDSNKEATWEFKLRDTAEGDYLTVFMGGTDVENYVFKELVLQTIAPAGNVELVENDKDYYVDGAQVLDLSEAEADWLEAVTINVYDGETLAGTIDKTTGNVALDAAPDEAKEYTIKFEGTEGFEAVEDMTASIISAGGAAIAELTESPTIDNDPDAAAWTITVPADTDDVTFTVTVDDVATEISSERTVVVDRPANDGDDSTTLKKVVVVTATAGTATKTWTFNVTEYGAVAAVIADEVTVFTRDNVYGKTGYKLIKIATNNVDYTSKTITIGEQTLYYSVDKNAFYGVVSAADVGANEVTAESVAAAAEITDNASAVFYFGKANKPDNPRGAKVTALDVAAAKKIVLKTSTPDINVYLAADVNNAEPDGNITALDVAALKKNVLTGAALPVVG